MDKQIKALEDLITTEYSNITGIAINKNGQNIYEAYFNGYTPDDTTHIMSVTKSILSALIGIAIDNNYIQSCLVHNKNTQSCRGDSSKLQREFPQ